MKVNKLNDSSEESPLKRIKRIISASEDSELIDSSSEEEKELPDSTRIWENEDASQVSDHDLENGEIRKEKVDNFENLSPEEKESDTKPVVVISKTNATSIEEKPNVNDSIDQTYDNSSVTPWRNQKKNAKPLKKGFGCLLKTLFIFIAVLVVLSLCLITFGFYQYYQIAATLPGIDDLRDHASKFETTRILDRNGDVLYEIIDPNAGRRTYVSLSKISPYVVAATIATEDKGFYTHPGVDPFAIVRALFQNYSTGETISGASTITQQLARNLLFSPEERNEQTYQRKIREAILATEITRRYSKDEILELYLNENYYGNLAYGIEAAAETYFDTTADKLTLAQSAFLAGLPQAPAVYDVYTSPELTFNRTEDVLVLMYEASQDQGCIYVSNNPRPICIDPVTVTSAANEIRTYDFKLPNVRIKYPHWVNYIRSLLEEKYDPQTIYRAGFTVFTTLDPKIQDLSQAILTDNVESLQEKNVTDGALVAIKPSTGEILSMIGSADFYNESISGQVNMAISPRQPGSSIKPVTYLAAFEKGLTPASLIWDVPTTFTPSGEPDDPAGMTYKPVNYDGRFHGPVTIRSALANSYNVPAVKTLNYVGIYGTPEKNYQDGFIAMAQRLGITTLTRPDYGLSLTLGGGEVTLLELTGVYATLANNGIRIPPYAISKILDHTGKVVYEYQRPQGEQVIRAEHSYLITSILSDNEARTPAFGSNSVLNLPFPAAAKTGTTNDFRDSLTIGYTPEIAIGVWVGNADYTPMQNVSGLHGAAIIWSEVMKTLNNQLMAGRQIPFTRPGGIVEHVICAISGTEPSKWCPKQTTELFAADQPPLPKEEDLWQKILIDTWTNLKASYECNDFVDEKFVINVSDPFAREWLKKDSAGKALAKKLGFPTPLIFSPSRECKAEDPKPRLEINSPHDNDTIIQSPLEIFGIVDATDWFDSYEITYGKGDKPVKWKKLTQSKNRMPNPGKLYSWDVSELKQGIYTVRVFLKSKKDTYAELLLHIKLQVPTPTPTPTNTPTLTPTLTPTSTPTNTPTLTSTSTFTPTPTFTIFPPTVTPVYRPTARNTPIPSSTPTGTTP